MKPDEFAQQDTLISYIASREPTSVEFMRYRERNQLKCSKDDQNFLLKKSPILSDVSSEDGEIYSCTLQEARAQFLSLSNARALFAAVRKPWVHCCQTRRLPSPCHRTPTELIIVPVTESHNIYCARELWLTKISHLPCGQLHTFQCRFAFCLTKIEIVSGHPGCADVYLSPVHWT